MPILQQKPVTPSGRFFLKNKVDLDSKRPERSLTKGVHRKKGRNSYGRITSRRRGGGHKKLYREIDFRRSKLDVEAKVIALEYDPNRTAHLALLEYSDGVKSYILAPASVEVGDTLLSSNDKIDFKPGNALPLKLIPLGTKVHCVEMLPNAGAKLARSAGCGVRLISVDGNHASLKMPSGEIRLVKESCRATIGSVGNVSHQKATIGKAGRNRWKGRRPRVRGVAMNPVDHPMGGGEGRTSGGGHPSSPWGQLSKGFPTRKKSKPSNSQILVRRNGRRVK
ncbi:MAG: 50S ribosomal protein L2 [Opitutae bacterium]|nr:50S ribosomal protein L2 [Opitutae bacterium]|tara:strand:- start:3993 stop:4832 length:840 start_codon:yes stop_codon:yes gene_type:complete